MDGTHRGTVRAHCVLSSAATWQCQRVQPAGAQCDPVRRRARVQVAGHAASLRELAHDLYPHESLVQKRGARPGVRTPATRPVDKRIKLEAVSLDSTIVKVHPDGTGALKKTVPKPSANPAAGGPPIHLVRRLVRHNVRAFPRPSPRCAGRAQAPHALGTARRAAGGGPPNQGEVRVCRLATRVDPWEYDRELYNNEVTSHGVLLLAASRFVNMPVSADRDSR